MISTDSYAVIELNLQDLKKMDLWNCLNINLNVVNRTVWCVCVINTPLSGRYMVLQDEKAGTSDQYRGYITYTSAIGRFWSGVGLVRGQKRPTTAHQPPLFTISQMRTRKKNPLSAFEGAHPLTLVRRTE